MGTQLLCEGATGQIVADLVFVHGLRGDPIKTWSKGSWGYDSSIANVTEFSSQNSIFGHAENLLNDIARKRRKPEEKSRPIVFVGHSLGGLVIKEALIRSSEYLNNQQDERLGSIYKHTAGVVFLGTPHRGSEQVGLGQVVAKVAACALRQPNDKLLKNLDKESDVLERQRRSFASINQAIPLVCLWEEKPTVVGIIVPEWSACIDGFQVKTGSIPANHMQMCKYENSDSIGYQRTSGHIINLVDAIAEKEASANYREVEIKKESEEAATSSLLSSLEFPAMNNRHDQIEEAHKHTFQWIYKEGPFLQWLKHESGIFWVNGKAGAGKSTLMKFIFNDPRTKASLGADTAQYQLIFIGFFFHDRGTILQKSLIGLLKSILYQIVTQCKVLGPIAGGKEWLQIKDWHLENSVRLLKRSREPAWPEWTRPELLRALTQVLKQIPSQTNLFLLIDGLDEYEGDKDGLIDFLTDIPPSWSNTSRTRLCLSSRPLNVFQDAFGNGPSFRLQDLTYKDIRMYVAGSLNKKQRMQELVRIDSNSASKLIDDIVQKADGVFLWVKLVVKSLITGFQNYDSIMDLEKRLAVLPSDLEQLYNRMLENIDGMYLAKAIRVFRIMQTTRRPPKTLSLWYATEEEFQHVDKFVGEHLTIDDKLVRCKEVDGRLRSHCAGLLEIQFTNAFTYEETLESGSLQAEITFPQSRYALLKSTVQYLHQTVKEYLNKPEVSSLLFERCPNLDFTPHAWLQRSYLREIRDCLSEEFCWKVFVAKRHNEPGILWQPLDEFMHHTRMVEKLTGTAQTLLLENLDNMLSIESPGNADSSAGLARIQHWSQLSPARFGNGLHNNTESMNRRWNDSLLTFAIASGLQLYVQEVLQRPRFRIDERDGRPFLHYVVNPGDGYLPVPEPEAMLEILISHGANPKVKFQENCDGMPVSAWELVGQKLQNSSSAQETVQLHAFQTIMQKSPALVQTRQAPPSSETISLLEVEEAINESDFRKHIEKTRSSSRTYFFVLATMHVTPALSLPRLTHPSRVASPTSPPLSTPRQLEALSYFLCAFMRLVPGGLSSQ
ncbi:hypothetical protein G7Y89_g11938 [Cudoniella acicularis]|uniref:NACHT domain-containing protein n=1 Tax=Cudoniella acicularis TaxID=354080 RepID=A0A8H4RC72_9HELO|nr:hypothetical protein G7Y89_g11938 [Cudoniella acicularis]